MRPITEAFENLRSEFSKFIVTYDYFKIDLNHPENINIRYLNLPGQDIILEGHRLSFNGISFDDSFLKEIFNKVQKELSENLQFSAGHNEHILYLDLLIDFSSKIEESIIIKNGKWTCYEIVYEGFNYDDLPEIDKLLLSERLKSIKLVFRDLLSNAKAAKQSMEYKYADEKLVIKNISNVTSQNLIHYQSINAFEWQRKEDFKRDMLFLFKLLTDKEYLIIADDTDFNDFCYAFSGGPLHRTLKIKWLVEGKNKETSKSSLFYFISRLQDHKLINPKDWSSNNGPLYKKVFTIFLDKSGNPFSIAGLKSSMGQSMNVRNCAKQTEINEIITDLASLNTTKTSK